jgi:hypothetical protein
MAFPCYYKNSETDTKFLVTIGAADGFVGRKITATEDTWNLFKTKDWGSVDWQVQGNTFDLHTIQSHPEEGSGLGSLMMYLAAKEALAANCPTMNILSAATTERDFYTHMGCTVDLTALAHFNQAEFTENEWKSLSASCPVVGNTAAVLLAASRSVVKRWTN